MSWHGNITNNPPNRNQLPPMVSEVVKSENRAFNTRRDTDTVKNMSITLEDIDSTIFNHLNGTINPFVLTEGNVRTKVPIVYGNPERWKSTQIDGVFKDYNGKIQLPVMMFMRDGFEKNENLMTLNRHLKFPVMTKYTEKNKYDKFSLLTNQAAPVNSVYMITLPDHIKITYKFMVWTELVEQLNGVIERINFASEDYWGDKNRYRFRVYASNYSTPIELSVGKDRMVRSEFTLTVMGYLLPDNFEDKSLTTQKLLTPRKVVVSGEATTSDLTNRNPVSNSPVKTVLNDGFIQLAEEAPELEKPVISGTETVVDSTIQQIKNAYVNMITVNANKIVEVNANIWHPAPTSAADYGEEGWMAYDGNFHYIYANGSWRRQPITNFTNF